MVLPGLSCTTSVPVSPDTATLTVYCVELHVTVTVTFPVIVPLPFEPTVQVSPEGWVTTETAYEPPLGICGLNGNVPFVVSVMVLPGLSCTTTVPVSPDIATLTVYSVALHVTVTVTFPLIVPLPFEPTAQVSPEGCVTTETAYEPPLGICGLNGNVPFVVSVMVLPGLSCTTTVPVSPDIATLTVYSVALHVTVTVTFPLIVPLPFEPTAQVSPEGCVTTETAYEPPLGICGLNGNVPFVVSVMVLPGLSCTTTVPVSPDIATLTVYSVALHVTVTVTFPLIVPLPFEPTAQVSAEGFVTTETAYEPPLGICGLNGNVPFVVSVMVLPGLSCTTTVPVSPDIATLTVYSVALHVTVTVTFPLIVPLPFEPTAQVSPEGCVTTETAYEPPLGICGLNGNVPFVVSVMVLPGLSCTTTVPVSPDIATLTVYSVALHVTVTVTFPLIVPLPFEPTAQVSAEGFVTTETAYEPPLGICGLNGNVPFVVSVMVLPGLSCTTTVPVSPDIATLTVYSVALHVTVTVTFPLIVPLPFEPTAQVSPEGCVTTETAYEPPLGICGLNGNVPFVVSVMVLPGLSCTTTVPVSPDIATLTVYSVALHVTVTVTFPLIVPLPFEPTAQVSAEGFVTTETAYEPPLGICGLNGNVPFVVSVMVLPGLSCTTTVPVSPDIATLTVYSVALHVTVTVTFPLIVPLPFEPTAQVSPEGCVTTETAYEPPLGICGLNGNVPFVVSVMVLPGLSCTTTVPVSPDIATLTVYSVALHVTVTVTFPLIVPLPFEPTAQVSAEGFVTTETAYEPPLGICGLNGNVPFVVSVMVLPGLSCTTTVPVSPDIATLTVYSVALHVTVTVTFPLIVPLPFEPTAQVSPEGCVTTETAYEPPLGICGLNGNVPFVVSVMVLPGLSCTTTVPVSPDIATLTVYRVALHVTVTVTSPVIVPLPFEPTAQVSPDGCVTTETAYGPPLGICGLNANVPFVVSVMVLPGLSCTTSVPVSPDIATLTVYSVALHVTATVTFPVIVPLPFEPTAQVSPDGWVTTETAYGPPLGICGLNANVPFVVSVMVLPGLSCTTSVPVSPDIATLTVYSVELHVTATLVTLPLAVPLPLVTVQVWIGFVGWVSTV